MIPGESGIGLRVVPLHGREGQPSLSCGRPQTLSDSNRRLSRTHPSLIRSIKTKIKGTNRHSAATTSAPDLDNPSDPKFDP